MVARACTGWAIRTLTGVILIAAPIAAEPWAFSVSEDLGDKLTLYYLFIGPLGLALITAPIRKTAVSLLVSVGGAVSLCYIQYRMIKYARVDQLHQWDENAFAGFAPWYIALAFPVMILAAIASTLILRRFVGRMRG